MFDEREIVCVETIFGPMLAYAGDLITGQLVDFGAHTRPELAFLLTAVRSGDAVFDLGAHIGSFTVPLALAAGAAGRVLAVDAIAANIRLVERNAALNGVAERVAVRCTLVAPTHLLEPIADDGNTGATYFRAASTPWCGDVTTIDALAAEYFVPSLIKIDIEGGEAAALAASDVVRAYRPAIYAEISPKHLARAGSSVAELDALLRGLDYRLFRNAGPRNAAHDDFDAVEMDALADIGRMYDVLAVNREDARAENLSRSARR